MMKLLPSDLADNSDTPKVLKLQDIDIWTRDELIEFINKHHNRRDWIDEEI